MKNFKPSALTLALMLSGVTLASMPSFAADDDKDKKKEVEPEAAVEVIEIRGFRRSLIESLNTKRYSDTVVEAVSADDMGALPDVSIADAISRLPGVTAVRSGGQSSELNIRGMSGGFVFSTLNGREIVTDQGGRSVQFDQYPSELINQVQVYKSQKASLVEGGVAGSIELKTANALENDQDHTFTIQTKLSYNDAADSHPDADPMGNRLSFAYQGKFLDETLGVSIGYARLQQPKISTQFVSYQPQCGILPFNGAPTTSTTDCDGLDPDATGAYAKYIAPTGFELMARGGEELREGLMGSITYQPNDTFTLKADGFYSKFDSQGIDRGFRVSGIGSILDGSSIDFENPVLSGDNSEIIVGGTYYRDQGDVSDNPPYPRFANTMTLQVQADDNTTNSEVLSFGLNAEWILNDDLTMTIDVAHSEGESNYRDEVMRLATFNDASATNPVVTDDIVLNYELNGLNLPSISFNDDIQNALSDPSRMMVGSLEKYPHIEENSANSARLDFKLAIDSAVVSSLETGIRWSDRAYHIKRQAYNYCDIGNYGNNLRNGNYVLGYDQDGTPIESETCRPYQLKAGEYEVVQLEGDFADFPAFISVDNDYIESTWLANEDTQARQDWRYDWTIWQESEIKEETLAFYIQANLDTEVFGLGLSGNLGVRVINSTQQAIGVESPAVEGAGDPIYDDFGVARTIYKHSTLEVDYTDILPSMNLSLQLSENDQLRFAAAKVMARPEMGDMAVSGQWSYGIDQEDNLRKANLNRATSPEVRPFYANQFDLSLEHYFSETEGALIFALYYKDIESFPESVTIPDYNFEAAGVEVPAVDNNGVPVVSGDYTVLLNNGQGGFFKGAEVTYTQTFSFLPGIWQGLGVSASYSYTESEVESEFTAVAGGENSKSSYPFLSPRVWTAALFFDWDDTLSTRINARYREEYVGNQIALGDEQKAFFAEELIVDYQASWQFSEELQGIFSVNNLTDEPNRSYFGTQAMTGTLQYFGRQFYVGLNAKF
jgi:phosphoribosylformimino-5-aminoimidazole carboxamide ribotide isomerase